MGPRRLWIALLLAALQYAGVHAAESCTAQNALLASDCSPSIDRGCETINLVDDASLTCNGGKSIFIKKDSNPQTLWEPPASDIKCDTSNGQWTHNGAVVAADAQVVCANSAPVSCPLLTPAQCYKFTEDIGCDVPTIVQDDSIICFHGLHLYSKQGSAAWMMTTDSAAICNLATGKWMETDGGKETLASDTVICATKDPKDGICADLPADYCAGRTIAGCKEPEPVTGNVLGCKEITDKLYFKTDPISEKKWTEARSIKCEMDQNAAVWKIRYHWAKDTFAPTMDKAIAICAPAYPDQNACPTFANSPSLAADYDSQVPENPEPGKHAKCTPISIPSSPDPILLTPELITDKEHPVNEYMAPTCDMKGKWAFQDPTTEGDAIGCFLPKCKQCPLPPGTIPTGTDIDGIQPLPISAHTHRGRCAALENRYYEFVIELQGEAGKLRFHNKMIECTQQKKFMVDNKVVVAVLAVQSVHCFVKNLSGEPEFIQIKTDCPSGNVINNCVSPVHSRDNYDVDSLKCNNKQKMLIKEDSGDYYYDLTENKIKCNPKTLTWPVTLARYNEPRELDKYTVFCGDSNPNPEPTTTTTTRGPPEKICELCEKKRPANITDCEKCDSSKLTYEESSFSEKTCIITATSGHILVINDLEDDGRTYYRGLVFCTRTEKYGENVEWTDALRNEILKISARSDSKRDGVSDDALGKRWRPMSYVVVALAFVAIVGMGIGCVVIYIRMRKKLPVKKERGVTKKLPSSNVVNTNNVKLSATGSMENGKSKEPLSTGAKTALTPSNQTPGSG